MMLKLFKKIVVFAVSIGVIGLGLPRSSGAAGGSLEGGKSSADEAATFKAEQSTDALGFAYIQPDSTEFEFPEDENKNLDGFGTFLVQEKQGGGGDEQDPLMFTLTLDTFSQAVADNFAFGADGGTGVFFAAHIRGINAQDEQLPGSHWVGGDDPIPAPGAAILAMIGFAMVGKIKRRFA